jgi:mxaK protein
MLLGGAVVGVLYWGAGAVQGSLDAERIQGLAAGRDLAAGEGDPPEVLRARARFLLERDRLDEAEALVAPITLTGAPGLVAAFFRDLGDARLNAAFRGMEDGDLDETVPQVRLAKEAYRRSLALRPDDFPTKVNLDLAMRLVRDFPRSDRTGAEDAEPRVQPKSLWTELPGMPEGLP